MRNDILGFVCSVENGALRVMPFTDNPAYNADGVAGVTSTAAPRDGASHQPMYQHTSASIDSDNGVNLTYAPRN